MLFRSSLARRLVGLVVAGAVLAGAPTAADAATKPQSTGASALSLYSAPTQAGSYLKQYPALAAIANTPQATWLGPDWAPRPASTIRSMAHAAGGRDLQLVVYGIPDRDNGGYSSGGATSESSYYAWVKSIAAAIGSNPAIVVVEPDALGLSTKLSASDSTARLRMLSRAITLLDAASGARVYLDASMWIPVARQVGLVNRLHLPAGVGFALNTSSYATTTQSFAYGDALSAATGDRHYIVDTSRNGQGPNGNLWCNPAGRGLGRPETPGADRTSRQRRTLVDQAAR